MTLLNPIDLDDLARQLGPRLPPCIADELERRRSHVERATAIVLAVADQVEEGSS